MRLRVSMGGDAHVVPGGLQAHTLKVRIKCMRIILYTSDKSCPYNFVISATPCAAIAVLFGNMRSALERERRKPVNYSAALNFRSHAGAVPVGGCLRPLSPTRDVVSSLEDEIKKPLAVTGRTEDVKLLS
ncbi:hypothetical protein EVAR_709_1 [Eumeta japonica]|uniref:Uncharacterized protein n=1 Tax=Eumeta variegata TaxID=151549 RepID=A0A4C1SEF6_EUMVA|nr:hypothetical protein EVAR_709_1 [Eumeta japonica]